MPTLETPKGNTCEICIEKGLLDRLDTELSTLFQASPLGEHRIHVVTDDVVVKLYGDRALCSLKKVVAEPWLSVSVLPHGEVHKTLGTVSTLYDDFARAELTRSDLVLALGGGVVGDLAGYAAASYLRGLPIVQVPTTLLAQVDSSIGGKTGVNLPQGKNLVGAFHQPLLVLIDPDLTLTLPDRLFAEGMSEVLKYGAIVDAAFFESLTGKTRNALTGELERIVCRCCEIKADIVQRDPTDNGERIKLNFGHTVGHALEEAAGYGSYFHGEAVGIGMTAAAAYGELLGLTEPGTAKRIASALSDLGLPSKTDKACDLQKAIAKDKKRVGKQIDLVLLRRVGEAFIHRMAQDALFSGWHPLIVETGGAGH